MRALVKKSPQFSVEDILDKFLEDEKYYLEINNPHFEFLQNYLDDNKFLDETLLYLEECRKYYDYKKKQEPLIQAQKEFEKKNETSSKKLKCQRKLLQKTALLLRPFVQKYNIEKKS